MKTDNTFDASKNNWNTTNKFQTDASGNKGITFNSGIQKQLNQLNDPLKKFWLKYEPLLLRKTSCRQAPSNAQRKPHPQTPVYRDEHLPRHQILKSTKDLNQPLVPGEGVEPSLPCRNQILSLTRLPIPPSGHERKQLYPVELLKCRASFFRNRNWRTGIKKASLNETFARRTFRLWSVRFHFIRQRLAVEICPNAFQRCCCDIGKRFFCKKCLMRTDENVRKRH